MFTGLIEELGSLKQVSRQGEGLVITIQAKRILVGLQLGDSISVNGVCLTVIRYDASSVSMDVMPETYRRTTLGQLSIGAAINLERAMLVGSRFGGHIVQGHIDGTAFIRRREPQDNAIYFTIEPHSTELMRFIIPKGSIAVDGISLTVVDMTEQTFRISIIPLTLNETILINKQPGESVNLETDIIGKYVERLLTWQSSSAPPARLTEHFLRENGFM
jgi:riboflavin synthase